MNIKDKITIIIPCKNEVNYISNTILSIVRQQRIKGTKVIIADANSTDGTREKILELSSSFKDVLNIEMIDGGKVAYGRNKGSEMVNTKYILFMDADVVLMDTNLIDRTLFEMYHFKLDLLTCRIKSCGTDFRTKLTFTFFNIINYFISKKTPFAVGTYFLTKRDTFRYLGGFDEKLEHSEDYLLSKKYNPKKFRISHKFVGQDDRRFKKMGYFGMLKLVIKSFINRNNYEYFQKDVNYWK